MITPSLLDAIKVAKENEKLASESYRGAIQEIQHSVGKRLFQELSDFEQYHYEKLSALEKSLIGEGKYINYEGKAFPIPPVFEIKAAVEPQKKSLMTIITQAIALILTVLIIGQQGYTGGVNGITDLKTLLGWDIRTDSAKLVLYYVCAVLLLAAILACGWVQRSKLGTLLLAMRDKEDRVRFSGYDVAMFKVFAFVLAAVLAAIGGALFTLPVGFMSPSFVGIVPSIEMVIFAAVGGRMSLVGAVFGALLVNFGKTYFSETFPELWLFLMAALFIGVVLAFPNGLAGLLDSHVKPWLARRRAARLAAPAGAESAIVPAPAAAPRKPEPVLPPGLAQEKP